MDNQKQDHRYTKTGFLLDEDVPSPSYPAVLDWMKVAQSKSIAFDIWARGNYARRIISNRKHERNPVIVPFKYVDEMRWAYRRLALMGLPVEFVYTGNIGAPKHILTLHPAGDYLIDAGWGYIAALGSIVRKRGREWFPVVGYSQLMPELVLEWITTEAPNAFLKGDVFIAPAELVGIDRTDFLAGSRMLGEIEHGTIAMEESKAVEVIENLDLPHLEGLSASAFETLIMEHSDDLVRFRSAIRKLVRGYDSTSDVIEEIRAEVAEMSYSDKNLRFRRSITKFGGSFTTFAAAVGATISAVSSPPSAESLVPAAAAATLGGAAFVLVDLWKQKAESHAKIRENRLSILWDLGLQKAERVRRKKRNISFHKYHRLTPAEVKAQYDCHWMCPPVSGLGFLAVKK